MSAQDLLSIEWNCMRDRPNVGYPWRAPVLAHQQVTNEHGVTYDAAVLTNRTRKRWWLEVKSDGWLRVYLTTTSTRKRDMWLTAFSSSIPRK